MKKYILLILCTLVLTSCGNNQKTTTDTVEKIPTEQEVTLNTQESKTDSILDSNMSCIQSWIISEPGMDSYNVKTCMSTNTLGEDMFKILCELWSQLEWADIEVQYVKDCPKPYHGVCKNSAPEQSVKSMWGNWDIYYYNERDVVKDSSWKPYCDNFESGAL